MLGEIGGGRLTWVGTPSDSLDRGFQIQPPKVIHASESPPSAHRSPAGLEFPCAAGVLWG